MANFQTFSKNFSTVPRGTTYVVGKFRLKDIPEKTVIDVLQNKYDIKFSVKLNLDGGTCETDSVDVVLGEISTLPTPEKTDKAFGGWYADEALTTKIESGSLIPYDVRNLYAKWADITYTELSYIEGTGTQWLDTGIIPDANTMVQLKLTPTMATGDVLFGCIKSDNSDWRFFNYSNNIYFDIQSSRINGSSCKSGSTYEFELGNYYVKNVGASSDLLAGTTQSSTSISTTMKFLYHDANGAIAKAKFYYTKIYNGTELIADYIPVLDPFNVPCMYDKVSNKFIYNQGTGTFAYSA